MTKFERKIIADKFRRAIANAENVAEMQGCGNAYQLGWLKQDIRNIAAEIETGRFPGKEAKK